MSAACWADNAVRCTGQAMLHLGWSPDTAWSATPEELAAVFAALAPPAAAPPDAGAIAALRTRFPDTEPARTIEHG